MRTQLAKIAFAVLGFAIAIFLSCSDNQPLEFPSIDEVRQRHSCSSGESSSSAELSSSSEPGSSSDDSSSSSSEPGGSSSSSEEASSSSCDEADKCGGKCYNKETHFCINGKTLYEKCGGNTYNVQTMICCGSAQYPKSSHNCCGGVGYLLSGYGCRDNAVLTKCGAEELYNPQEEFCASDGTAQFLCGGKQFDHPKQMCIENVITGECGDEPLLNYNEYFCYDEKSYPLCDGRNYKPDVQFCYNNAIENKCGGTSEYDLSTHFCYNGLTYSCGGKPYNPSTHYCHTDGLTYTCGNEPYNPEIKFCHDEVSYLLCGGEDYDPSTRFCSGTTIYSKCGGTVAFTPGTEQCCGSNKYTLATQGCCKNNIYERTKEHYGKPKAQFCDERDGKAYVKVDIGTGATAQTWMAENLNYRTPDGASRCYPTSGNTNSNDNDNANCNTYGRFYNWATALSLQSSCNSNLCASQISAKHRGICPDGWHLPSDAEWTTLTDFVGGSSTAGTKLKATSSWNPYNGIPVGTDDYGFAALAAGRGYSDDSFGLLGINGYWWSSFENDADKVYILYIYNDNKTAVLVNSAKSYLRNVRCVKD